MMKKGEEGEHIFEECLTTDLKFIRIPIRTYHFVKDELFITFSSTNQTVVAVVLSPLWYHVVEVFILSTDVLDQVCFFFHIKPCLDCPTTTRLTKFGNLKLTLQLCFLALLFTSSSLFLHGHLTLVWHNRLFFVRCGTAKKLGRYPWSSRHRNFAQFCLPVRGEDLFGSANNKVDVKSEGGCRSQPKVNDQRPDWSHLPLQLRTNALYFICDQSQQQECHGRLCFKHT
jgi:hypothetical protein